MYIKRENIPDFLALDEGAAKVIVEAKVDRLKDFFARSGFGKAIIGLSGGIDSAVSCALAAWAIGPENVIAVRLPFRKLNDRSSAIAAEVAAACGLPPENLRTVDITAAVETSWSALSVGFAPLSDAEASLRLGNIAARERMKVLMDMATHFRGLVLGTENRTEEILAYYTIGGDNISGVEPIQDLWKVQVFQVAEALGLPASVVDRVPSAELCAGQTDEGEIGASYLAIDTVLAGLEMGKRRDELTTVFGIAPETITGILARAQRVVGKRRAPHLIGR